MKILSVVEPLPPHITTGTPPWNQRNPIIHTKIHLTRTWRLRAEAKGFNRAPARILQQKETENATAESINRRKNVDSKDEKIPDVVLYRIIRRILLYVGVPLGTGIVLLKALGAAKVYNLWDVPYWFPILTTLITFGASTLGIAYGALSTSWDANREGSFLGLEEAAKNWDEMWREEDDD